MITIVNLGLGNIGSLVNIFQYLGYEIRIASDPRDILTASKLLLPGVGKFDAAMSFLNKNKSLYDALQSSALVNKTPLLGICLGMQILTSSSEEGLLPGLGWIPGNTSRILPTSSLKVPHMGWNTVFEENTSPLTSSISVPSERYYFAHSYSVSVHDPGCLILSCHYSSKFAALINKENIYGVQFHPEKSSHFGMRLLQEFAQL